MTLFDDRTKLEVLRRHDCLELLDSCRVGRVALLADERIVVFPVNYLRDGDRILFRSDAGAKLTSALTHQSVAFEIDQIDETARTGWNVLVHGEASVVEGPPEEIDRLDWLGLHPWARTPKEHWIQIALEDVSGRRVLSIFEQDAVTREGY